MRGKAQIKAASTSFLTFSFNFLLRLNKKLLCALSFKASTCSCLSSFYSSPPRLEGGAHWKAWWKRGSVVVLRLELNTGGRGCRGPRPRPPPELCCS